MNIIQKGSRVKTKQTGNIYSDGIIGTVLSFSIDNYTSQPRMVVEIKIEKAEHYNTGYKINFYETDLELLDSSIDPTSQYQYCRKCDVLTSNKPNICCDCK